MKTIFMLILVFMAIAISWFFLNKKSSKDNMTTVPAKNLNETERLSSGSKPSSEKIINSDNFGKNNMKITSPAFENNKYIPSKYTCDGVNINPPLSISGVPEKTKSLVLIVDDPDAPNGGWVHWIVLNIPPDTKEIRAGSAPEGSAQGRTDFKNPGYGGPCPPSGIHHYHFKLYALDTILNLETMTVKKNIEEGMVGHILAQDLLVGLYKRN